MKKLLLTLLLGVLAAVTPALADSFQLVTSANQLFDGDEVIVVAQAGEEYYSTQATYTTGNVKAVAIPKSCVLANGNIELDPSQTDVQIWILEYKNGHALKQKGGNQYITGAKGKTSTSLSTTAFYKDIVIKEDHAEVYMTSDPRFLNLYNKQDFRSYANTTQNNSCPVKLYKKVEVAPVTLGELIVVGPNGTQIENNDVVNITQGEAITISCENAEKIVVTNSNGYTIISNEDSENKSTFTWSPSKNYNGIITITAWLGTTKKSISFDLNVEEYVAPANTITIMHGDLPVTEDSYEMNVGELLQFSYPDADRIDYTVLVKATGQEISYNSTFMYAAKILGEFTLQIYAYKSGETDPIETRTLELTVVDPKPLGDIEVKCGDTFLPNDVDETVDLPFGAVLKISSENADRIRVKLGDNAFEKYLSDNVELKLTESGNFYFEVIADHNAENIYVTKTFSCSLNVAEKPFADQYKLVTSTNDISSLSVLKNRIAVTYL